MREAERAYGVIMDAVLRNSSECISLSGGLDSAIIAYFLRDKISNAVSVIAKDFLATDLTYCQLVAQKFGLPLRIKMAQTDEILEAIEDTIRILGNFNEIEIRNNVVMYLAIKEAKRSGFDEIVTGDGADEIFAGYNFLINKKEAELRAELDRISKIMHFPSHRIGSVLGVRVKSPFCDGEVADFASTLSPEWLVNVHNGKRFGKWVLRKAFEKKLPRAVVWRQKSPMQEGAGTQGLTEFFDSLIPDQIFLDKAKAIRQRDGVTIRNKESMHYYELFCRHHQIPAQKGHGVSCPDCRYKIDDGSKFCRMCGRFPL